jgi:hypothetical protein
MIQLLVSHSDPRVINLRFHDYNLSKRHEPSVLNIKNLIYLIDILNQFLLKELTTKMGFDTKNSVNHIDINYLRNFTSLKMYCNI